MSFKTTLKCFSNLSLKYLYYYFERILFYLVFNKLADISRTEKIFTSIWKLIFTKNLKIHSSKSKQILKLILKTRLANNFQNISKSWISYISRFISNTLKVIIVEKGFFTSYELFSQSYLSLYHDTVVLECYFRSQRKYFERNVNLTINLES